MVVVNVARNTQHAARDGVCLFRSCQTESEGDRPVIGEVGAEGAVTSADVSVAPRCGRVYLFNVFLRYI